MASRASAWRNAPAPGSVSATKPAGQQLGQPGVAAERGHQLEVEARPRHRGGLGGGARRVRQPGRAQEHRVADGLGHRDLAVAGELEAARARGQPPAGLQRAGQLLDEERHALCSVVDRPRQRGRQRRAEDLLGERRRPARRASGSSASSRSARDAAQLVAQAAQGMRARDLVGAIGAHDEDRQLAQRVGERAEQLQGGVVGPLQVVEEDHRRASPRRSSPARSAATRTASRGRSRRPPARARAAAARGAPAAGRTRRARRARRAGSRAARPISGRRAASPPGSPRRAAPAHRSPPRPPRPGGSCRSRPRRPAARGRRSRRAHRRRPPRAMHARSHVR